MNMSRLRTAGSLLHSQTLSLTNSRFQESYTSRQTSERASHAAAAATHLSPPLTSSCWLRFWLIMVASRLSCCTPLMLSLSSGT
jgi:hypothetical protein